MNMISARLTQKKLQKVRFDFQNIGKSPLILHDVHGYCGCIEASFSKTPIMPGKKDLSSSLMMGKDLLSGVLIKKL